MLIGTLKKGEQTVVMQGCHGCLAGYACKGVRISVLALQLCSKPNFGYAEYADGCEKRKKLVPFWTKLGHRKGGLGVRGGSSPKSVHAFLQTNISCLLVLSLELLYKHLGCCE